MSPNHFEFQLYTYGRCIESILLRRASEPTNRLSVAELLAEIPGGYPGARRAVNSHEGTQTARRAPSKEKGYSGSPTRAARNNR